MYNMVIIDDEEIVIDGLTTVVEWEEHQIQIVGTATNGQKGLEIILEKKPDIVLTDIRMPGLDGLQLIEEARKVLPDTVFVIVSGHAEFNYAKSAIELDVIDYLIKPVDIDDIIKVIKKSISQNEKRTKEFLKDKEIQKFKNELVEKYLLDLMLGLNVADVDLEKGLDNFSVFCIGFKTNNWNKKLQINSVMKKLKTLFTNENIQVYTYLIDDKIIIIIDKNNDYLLIANRFQEFIVRETSFCPVIGVGSSYREKKDISRSYKESNQAFQMGVYLNKEVVLFEEILNMERNTSEHYLKEIEVYFKDEAINYHLICRFIDGLINYSKDNSMYPDSFKKVCFEFISQFEKFIQREYEIEIEQFLREKFSIYEHLNKLTCIDDYGEFLKETIKPIFDYLEDNKVSPKEKIVIEVKKYLDHNYEKTIQLDDLANSFYISSSYLSYLFSKLVGITISDYLLNLRMNKAKELLRNTNYKIEKISNMVGYENSRYFNQVFKKNVKTTPSNYRSKHIIWNK